MPPSTVENRAQLKRRYRCELHLIAKRVQLADESRCSLFGDEGVGTGAALLIGKTIVEDLPYQAAEPMRHGPDGLGMAEAYE